MTIDQSIHLFFTTPDVPPAIPGKNSILYLLRRDVCTCFGIDPSTGNKSAGQAYFPGVMAILSGIDLLAKFKYGDDSSKVGIRYKDFVKEYISGEYEKELYHLRNAMLHSFGLYSEDARGRKFRFTVAVNTPKLIESTSAESYIVNINLLRSVFDEAVQKFWQDVQSYQTLRNRFPSMFEKYGYINIGY